MLIELKQMMKTYDGGTGKKYPVLKGVDFQMQSGEMVSILGKSGSGKSTLLRILGLLEIPDRGAYFFDGQDMRKQKRKWNQFRNKQIGFVMQDYALLERLSVFENIAAPMYIAHCSKQKIEYRVLSLVEKFQIGDLLDKAAYQLSGGEKQRVAIARAMVQKPKLLLADEPTGSLDDENAEIVLKTLKNIHQEGTGIILVTHDKRIAFSCDRVYRLQDGKLEPERKIEHPQSIKL